MKPGWELGNGVIYPPQIEGFVCGFTTRATGDFKDPAVAQGFAKGLGYKRLRLLNQVHETLILPPDHPLETPTADGWLGVPVEGELLGVRTADCLAVALFAKDQAAIVHAGWRGAVKGIQLNALEGLGDPAGITAILGPCIGPCCFEVGEDVEREISSKQHVLPGKTPGKFMVDLAGFVAGGLENAGILPQNIHSSGLCTVCEKHLLFSHRGGDTQRLCAFVGAK